MAREREALAAKLKQERDELEATNAQKIETINKKLRRSFELNKTVALPALEEIVARTRRPVEDADRVLLARQALLSANILHALHIVQRPIPPGPPPSVETFALYQAAQEVLTDFNQFHTPEDCLFANEIPRDIYAAADRFMIKQAIFSVVQWVNLLTNVAGASPVLQAVAKIEGGVVWTKFYMDYAEEVNATFEEPSQAADVLLEFVMATAGMFGGFADARLRDARGPELLLALPLGEKEDAGDASYFTRQEPENASPVSEADRIIIAPFLADVEKYEVYELTEIEEVLDQIPQQENDEVKKWVVEMRKAIYSCNETAYRELLDSVQA